MKHKRPLSDDAWSMIQEYSLGLLTDEKCDVIERHLESCTTCRDELAEQTRDLARVATRVVGAATPDTARIWERVQQRIAPNDVQTWKQWTASSSFVPVDSDTWEATSISGVEVKRLFVAPDRSSATMLIRMAAGTSYPAHRHAEVEQCFVVAGDLDTGERVMHAGDFEIAQRGSVHPVQSTENGCTLLISSSLGDELLTQA